MSAYETDCDAVIVGAGLSGLVAGAILAGRGKRVVLLDQADQVGGRGGAARTPEGYWIDYGHRDGHDPGDIQFTFEHGLEAAKEAGVELPLRPLSDGMRIHVIPEGPVLPYRADNFEAIAREVLECPAAAFPGLRALLQRFATASEEEKDRLVPETLGPWLGKEVSSPEVRRAMLRLVGMLWHRNPEEASAGRAMQVFGGGGHVSYIADDEEVGGAQGVMEPWARAIRARDGEIALGWKPVEIAIEGGRACGVVAVERNNMAREVRAPVVMLTWPIWELFDLASSRLFPADFVAAAHELSLQSGDIIGWQAGLRRIPRVRATGLPDDHTSWNRLLHARDRQYRGGFQFPSMMSRRSAPEGKHLLELVLTRWFRGGSRPEITWRAGKAELEENIAYLRRFYVDLDECVEWSRFQLSAAPQTLPWWWSPLRRHGLEAPGVRGLLLATTTLEAPASVGLVDLGAWAGLRAAHRALELLG